MYNSNSFIKVLALIYSVTRISPYKGDYVHIKHFNPFRAAVHLCIAGWPLQICCLLESL